jgi:hypothetical protein
MERHSRFDGIFRDVQLIPSGDVAAVFPLPTTTKVPFPYAIERPSCSLGKLLLLHDIPSTEYAACPLPIVTATKVLFPKAEAAQL